MITKINNDLFKGIIGRKSIIIIPHCANDFGAWGKGFVVPLGNVFPQSKIDYLSFIKENKNNTLLGKNVYTKIKPNFIVVSMIAQHGIGFKNGIPLRYDALSECMMEIVKLYNKIKIKYKVEIHCPTFGSCLAGGDASKIEDMIKNIWKDLEVFVYYL